MRAHSSSSAPVLASVPVGENNYITETSLCKDSFSDSDREVFGKFAPKHRLNEALSDSYSRIGFFEKVNPVFDCGSFLIYRAPLSDNGEVGKSKLYRANFCKDRLCPTCAYRRELKVFSEVSKAFDSIYRDGGRYEYIFLTLTVPSVEGEKLVETISRMQIAFSLLRRRRPLLKACRGYFKALEITVNKDRRSKSFGLYHPHFHVILAMDSDYYTKESRKYIPHSVWLKMWQESYNDFNIKFVNVEAVKASDIGLVEEGSSAPVEVTSKAVAEVCKYACKSADYLLDKDTAETDRRVETLSRALKNRRLIDMSGVFRKALAGSGVDDPDDLHLNGGINPALSYLVRVYNWHIGISNYSLTDEHIEKGIDLLKEVDK